MALGPIELLVMGFPTLVDILLIYKDDNGDVEIVEVDQVDAGQDVAALSRFLDESNGLISEEDMEGFADALEPGSSAAALAFEHTWFKPLRDELIDSGGILLDNIRIPGLVVEEILEAVAALEDE